MLSICHTVRREHSSHSSLVALMVIGINSRKINIHELRCQWKASRTCRTTHHRGGYMTWASTRQVSSTQPGGMDRNTLLHIVKGNVYTTECMSSHIKVRVLGIFQDDIPITTLGKHGKFNRDQDLSILTTGNPNPGCGTLMTNLASMNCNINPCSL